MGKSKGHELKKFYGKLGFNYEQNKYDTIIGFSHVVSVVAKELCDIYNLNFLVNEIPSNSPNGDENSKSKQSFLIEFSDFLREYGFPYLELIQGDISTRFASPKHRVIILKFLCAELIVARKMCKERPQDGKQSDHSQITLDISEHFSRACRALGLPQPSFGTDINTLFATLFESTSKALKTAPPNYIGMPMLPITGLSDDQWTKICHIGQVLDTEYTSRRETLIKRADCTVQSFKWSDCGKAKMEEIERTYNTLRGAMKLRPWLNMIPHILAARDVQLLRLEKTSSGVAREFTSSPLNRILMSEKVPDRGGRAWEIEALPPEMPSFKKRQAGGGRGGAGKSWLFKWHSSYRGNRGSRGGGRGGGRGGDGVGGGRGGFSANDSFGHVTGSSDSRPQTGISFERQDGLMRSPGDIVFQPQFFGGHRGRGRRNRR